MANSATTTTTPTTYLQLISVDEKTAQRENLVIKAQEAALTVSREILNLNAEINATKGQVAKTQKAIPYSLVAEFDAQKRLSDLEAKLAFATEIKGTRFTDASI